MAPGSPIGYPVIGYIGCEAIPIACISRVGSWKLTGAAGGFIVTVIVTCSFSASSPANLIFEKSCCDYSCGVLSFFSVFSAGPLLQKYTPAPPPIIINRTTKTITATMPGDIPLDEFPLPYSTVLVSETPIYETMP